MKLLLDECVVQDFRHSIVGHEVFTVAYMGWAGIKNGKLLATAGQNGFDALITTDRGMAFQQNTNALPLAVIILYAETNDLDDLEVLAGLLHNFLGKLPRNQITHVRKDR